MEDYFSKSSSTKQNIHSVKKGLLLRTVLKNISFILYISKRKFTKTIEIKVRRGSKGRRGKSRSGNGLKDHKKEKIKNKHVGRYLVRS